MREDVSVQETFYPSFECLAAQNNKNPDVLSELCRKSFGRNIIQKYINEKDELVVFFF